MPSRKSKVEDDSLIFCTIIPDDLLKKIKDKKSLEQSQEIREKRELGIIFKRAGKVPIPGDHDEVRVLYDAKNTNNLLELDSNIIEVDYEQDHKDVHTTEQLEMFDKVYDFFLQKLGMESYDNKDAIWKIFQHFGQLYNNAFWNGRVFAFGDGDQIFIRTFWIQNICTHEGMHAITDYVTQLQYQGQSGALNESISDVVAICLDHFLGADHWIIANGIWTDSIKGVGLRTFTLEPAFDDPIIGKDGQPKHMKDYYSGKEDHGGVHINSGILNHAFYLLCQKSGRRSYDAPLNIWWRAIQNTKAYDNFETFAWNTLQVAGELKEHLEQAWWEVGITPKKPNPTFTFLTYFINLLLSFFRR